MSSTIGIIVSYHPEVDILHNVQEVLKEVSEVVIVDNASSENSKKFLEALPKERVTIIFNTSNRGVAEGFNQGIRWGLERKYQYFVLFDQDSCPQRGMVEKLLEVSDALSKNNPLVLIGPHHEDYDFKTEVDRSEDIISTPLLITSGSLFTKPLIDAIGLYDERLFIDHVDHDYCLRLARRGGQIFRVNSATLLHKFGKAEARKFLGKKFLLQDYSAFRRYFMMRNRIVLYKRYGMFRGAWFRMDLRAAIVDFVKLILFEKNKVPKLRAVFKGIWDGLRWQESQS